MIQDKDLAMLIDKADKAHLITIQGGRKFETHHGFILYDAMIGRAWGSIIHSSLGAPYLVVQPGTADLIRHIKRSSQVIFPKDSSYILMKLNVKPGARVLESGCGSGGLTLALAQAVMPHGRLYSQEIREDFIALTKRNMEKVKLAEYITFIHADSTQGFLVDEPVDAVFLDMPEPWTCLVQARAALKDGGFFGSLVPTTNQVQDILRALEPAGFGLIEVEEVITRSYKTVAERLRPRDRMIAHTGYLIFARAIIKPVMQVGLEQQPEQLTAASTAPLVDTNADLAEVNPQDDSDAPKSRDVSST